MEEMFYIAHAVITKFNIKGIIVWLQNGDIRARESIMKIAATAENRE